MTMQATDPEPFGRVPAGPELFELGRTVITSALIAELEDANLDLAGVAVLLGRHQRGDWGVVDRLDAKANKAAVLTGERIFSVYNLPGGKPVWVITEGDRSATTALRPSDY